jgi:xylulokinase
MKSCLIGVDVGTSKVKVAAYDFEGRLLFVHSSPNEVIYSNQGFSHFDIDKLKVSVLRGLQALSATLKDAEPLAIGVSSVGESGVLVDAKGNVLYPAITWFDSRTKECRHALGKVIKDSRIHAITGMNPDHIYSLLKIMWIRDNYPKVFKRATRWLCIEDYVLFFLTGIPATDYTIASRTLAFNRNKKCWNTELLNKVDIDPALFSPVFPSGSPIGELRSAVRKRCHLPAKTIVATGGHDHVCAAYALGIIRPGAVMDSTGTSEALATSVQEIPDYRSTLKNHYDCYPHVVENAYILSGSLPTSGGSLEWARRLLGKDDNSFYSKFSPLAHSAPIGSNGVCFFPFLEGSGTPHGDREARGHISGISLSTNLSDIARSIFEGISFWLYDNIRVVESFIHRPIDEVVATGGGSKNELWLQIKADVIGKKLIRNDLAETVALGAAFLAGKAAGVFRDARSAQQNIRSRCKVIQPNSRNHKRYQELFQSSYLPQKFKLLS